MSKATKIIAGLGVVAGLGVAALPMASYAAQQAVKGQVTISAEVGSAIAMTIVGNGDPTSGEPPVQTPGVDVYTPTGATDIDGHTGGRLYNAGALETSSSTLSILPNAANTNEATSVITVYTNASGYTLNVQDANESNALSTDGGVHTIPAVGTVDLDGEGEGTNMNAVTPGQSAWGFKAGADADWRAVPTSAQDAAAITPAASGTAINVVYGVSTSADQATGTYTDTIVYTATTAN